VIDRVDTFVRNAAGKLIVNPRKLDVQSFWLTPDAPNNPIALGALANSGPISFTVSQDGPFEAFYITHFRGNETPVFVDIYDEGSKLRLVNRQVHIDTIFGRKITGVGPVPAGILPHLFSETLWIHATRSLIMNFVDGAAGNEIWPVVHGRRFYNYANPSEELAVAIEKRSARARLGSPFWMTIDNADITMIGGGPGIGFIRVPTVGHFEWHKLMVLSTGAFRYRVSDARNGRIVTNDWIHVDAGTGAGPLPLVLPEPTLFQPNSQIRVETVDLSGAPNTVYFTMAGRMIYVA
jgi:hypothetical protein